MNKWKIGTIGFLVILALLVTATGCGNDTADDTSEAINTSSKAIETVSSEEGSSTKESETAAKEDTEVIQGVWNTSWDMSALFDLMLMSIGDEALSDFVQVEGLDLPMQFTFQADGAYTVSADEEAFMSSLSEKTEEIRDGFIKYFEYTIEKEHLVNTVEELLAASGFDSMEDYLEALIGGFDGISESFEASGSWKIENGKLYMAKTSGESEINQYYTYQLTENELKLLELHTEEEDGDMAGLFGDLLGDMFPMVLTRAA